MTEIMQIVARTTEQKIKEAQIVIKKLQEANLDILQKKYLTNLEEYHMPDLK
jgi:hypothetical protein